MSEKEMTDHVARILQWLSNATKHVLLVRLLVFVVPFKFPITIHCFHWGTLRFHWYVKVSVYLAWYVGVNSRFLPRSGYSYPCHFPPSIPFSRSLPFSFGRDFVSFLPVCVFPFVVYALFLSLVYPFVLFAMLIISCAVGFSLANLHMYEIVPFELRLCIINIS